MTGESESETIKLELELDANSAFWLLEALEFWENPHRGRPHIDNDGEVIAELAERVHDIHLKLSQVDQ